MSTSLDLKQITGEALELFRQMLLGSTSRLIILETTVGGIYNKLGTVSKHFFVYKDPVGDVFRCFINEPAVKPVNNLITASSILTQCVAIGVYMPGEGLNLGEYTIYKFSSRKGPTGIASRMWEFNLSMGDSDIFID